MSRPDAIVVGAGVVGTAVARELMHAGLAVAIIEADFAGGGSTGAAMGHVVVMDDSPAQLRLTTWSRERWRDWFTHLPPGVGHDPRGTLWLAATEAQQADASRRVAEFAAHGIPAEWLDPVALRSAEPELAEGLAGGMLVPGDMICYPPAVARAFMAELIAGGAEWRGGRVVSVGAGCVRLSNGTTIAAGAIVIAAGSHAGELIPELPLMPRRGHLVITDRTAVAVRHQLVELGYLHSAHSLGGASVAFNVQPRLTGQLLIGSSRELVGFDPTINRELVASMLERAARFVPGLRRVRVSRSWVGFRPATPDALPLIGPWPALPGVWIATGHEGLGITMAPGTAALIVAGITGAASPIDPTPYRPDRTMPVSHAAA